MLRRTPERLLINELNPSTVTTSGGLVLIKGVGYAIDPADVISCVKECHDAGTPRKETVTVVIPSNNCHCISSWCFRTVNKTDNTYDLNNQRDYDRTWDYSTPEGYTPTAAEVAENIAAQIVKANSRGEVPFTAVYTTGDDFFQLCGTSTKNDFCVYIGQGMGSSVVDQAFERSALTADDLMKVFPIKMGQFGSRPDLTICGTYCLYRIKTRKSNDAQDLAHSMGYIGIEREVEIYVREDLANFQTDFDDELVAGLPCFAAIDACFDITGLFAFVEATGIGTITHPVGLTPENITWQVSNDSGDATPINITAGQGTAAVTVADHDPGDLVIVTVEYEECPQLVQQVFVVTGANGTSVEYDPGV